MRVNSFPSRLLGWLLLLLAFGGTARAQQVVAPDLGAAAAYGLLSGTDLQATNSSRQPVQVYGLAGAQRTLSPGIRASAGQAARSSSPVAAALAAARQAQAQCTALGGTSRAGQLDGQTLPGGAYRIAGNATLGQGARLTLTGNAATIIVLNITGSLTLAGQAQVVLSGVLPQHVFWNVGQDLQAAPGVSFPGVALAGGRITLTGPHFGRCALLSGGALTLTGLSATLGHQQFHAAARPADTCLDGSQAQTCSFTAPPGELIQDGSFEAYTCPPASISEIDATCYWHAPTTGSTDYYQADSDVGTEVSVPYNAASTRTNNGGTVQLAVNALGQNTTAQTGKGYVGLYAHTTGTINGNPYVYHEYVAQEVTTATLQAGHRYYAGFSVRLAPASGYRVGRMAMAIAPLGYGGYPNGLPDYNPLTPSSYPNTQLAVNAVMSGTPQSQSTNWTQLAQVFTPTQTYNGFTAIVGSFESNPTYTNTGPSNAPAPVGSLQAEFGAGAYYYIDNVTLSMVTEASTGTSITLGPTCLGGNGASSTTLGTQPMPTLTGATYAWTASPADPSLTTPNVANPTVSPTQNTTYTLTVTIPGQSSYTSTVTVNVAAVGIGTAGTTTTINAGGGTYTFNGRYNVRGPLVLTNGTFRLQPNTIFYIDNTQTYPNVTYGLTVDNATLQLTGATLRATCPGGTWTGVMMQNGSTLRTTDYGPPSDGDIDLARVRSLVRDMTVGIFSLPNCRYYVRNTDFVNNVISLNDFVDGKTAQYGEGAFGCTFSDGQTAISISGNPISSTGPLANGNYDLAQFTYNTFQRHVYGISAGAAKLHVRNNTFATCSVIAVDIASEPGSAGPPDVQNNTIDVPAAGSLQQQGVYGPYGIRVTGENISVAQNQITGSAVSRGGNSYGTGIFLNFTGYGASSPANQVTGNTISNLDEGIAGYTDDRVGNNLYATGNTLSNNAAGVVLYPLSYYPPNSPATVTLTLRCNSFVNDGTPYQYPLGLWVKDKAVVTTGLDNPSMPNGNAFIGYTAFSKYQQQLAVVNDNTARTLAYAPYASQYEGGILNPSGATTYSIRSLSNATTGYTLAHTPLPANNAAACPGGVGVQNSRVAPPAAVALDAQLDSLRRTLPAATRLRLTRALLARPVQPSELPALEAYLADDQQPAWQQVGLLLLQAYRQQPDPANASRLRARLLAGSADAELAAYLQLGEATDRLGSQLPGTHSLDAATRALLAGVAASGTTPALAACRLLRLYEPTCACRLPQATAPAAATAAPAPAPTEPVQLAAYPNPATTTLHVPYQLPAGVASAELHVYDALGRQVRVLTVTAAQAEVEVATRNWAAGLYQLVLRGNGRLLSTQRISIEP